LSEMIALLTL